MRSVEKVITRLSARGMARLLPYLPVNYCHAAAGLLMEAKRGKVLIATGFYVGGRPETDGPPGAFFLARALNKLGFSCEIVTDGYCAGLFDGSGLPVDCFDAGTDERELLSFLDRKNPTALVAIERCGANADGDYLNMRSESIAKHTARLDCLFVEGMHRGIPTVGIGDGGNEIGMGSLKGAIEREIGMMPCVTAVSRPVVATVSNWGAYGLCACLERLSGAGLLPRPGEIRECIAELVSRGCVDGVTRLCTPTVDGFPPEAESDTVRLLRELTDGNF